MDEKQNIPEPETESWPEVAGEAIKHPLKTIAILVCLALAVAIALTGYSLECGSVKIDHEPVKQLDGDGK